MDFSQTRLKLRVAVCPYVVPTGPEYHHRVVGMKREANSQASLVILRQFLLLLPLDCTFTDLTTLVPAQYEKLYKSQPAYVPIKSIALFRDSNQCDLDFDYLVSDICASNDLIYAMVEIEESNKKIKILDPKPEQGKNQSGNVQNEKKVPEFKPTPVKAPVKNEPKTVKIAEPVKQAAETKKVEQVPETKPQNVKAVENKVAEVKPQQNVKLTETKPQEVKATEHNTSAPATSKPAVPIKPPTTKKNQKQQVEEVKKEVTKNVTETLSEPVTVAFKAVTEPVVVKSVSDPVVKSVTEPVVKIGSDSIVKSVVTNDVEPVKVPVTNSVKVPVPSSVKVPTSTSNFDVPSEDDMITPVPTPIFHPRKSELPPISSSEDEEEDNNSVLNTLNLFGPQVITSEPRRSDAFVLFHTGSTDESSDSSDDNENLIPAAPLKSSSIVSLQAAPSSELCQEDESESEDEAEETVTQLPQSVTLRRLSSVSPIPDPSEIPSLSELKESINRAPTPNQINQQQQSVKNVKGGRPTKKQGGGRPKKMQT